jgi:hypothetical protein
MVLTTTDIGARPEDVEENLARNFKVAKNWNAVLLIDEADVFVANRTIEDLHRSSLVASMPNNLSEIEICGFASRPARSTLANVAQAFCMLSSSTMVFFSLQPTGWARSTMRFCREYTYTCSTLT